MTYKEGPMNTRTFVAFVIGLSAAGFASAQSGTLHANVPFNFVVNGKTLPAGEYSVLPGSSVGTMIVKGIGQSAGAFSLTIPTVDRSVGRKAARLEFHAYGDRYFLYQIWTGGEQGSEMLQSRLERELLAHRNSPNHSVVATLRQIPLVSK
jgi:hypothetical protein